MNRPKILNLLPPSIRERVFYRYFSHHQDRYRELFQRAELKVGTELAMHDLICGDAISASIAFNGFYEIKLSKEIQSLAKQGGRLVDVGANMG